MNFYLKLALVCVVSYLLGSLNFSIICSRIFQKDDVREHGSGNAGITNYLRNYGGFSTLIVMVGDLGKCIAAVLIVEALFRGDTIAGYEISGTAKFLAGFFVIIGHLYPVWFGFKGGKGVLSVAALILAFDWRVFLIAISLFIIIVLVTRYVSLGSILAVWFAEVLLGIFNRTDPLCWTYVLIFGLIAVIVTVKHASNIKRLVNHTESKFSVGKKHRE